MDKNFFELWNQKILEQSDEEYEDSKKYISQLFEETQIESIDWETLEYSCEVIARTLFDPCDNLLTLRGLDFVEYCYSSIRSYIQKDQGAFVKESKRQQIKFNLINHVYNEICIAIEHVDKIDILKEFAWGILFEDAVYCLICIDEAKSPEIGLAIESVERLCYLIGKKFAAKGIYLNGLKTLLYNELTYVNISSNEEIQEHYDNTIDECLLIIFFAYIDYEDFEHLKKIYDDIQSEIISKRTNEEALAYLGMMLHCRIYCIGHLLSEKHQTENKAYSFLHDNGIREEFGQFVQTAFFNAFLGSKQVNKIFRTFDKYKAMAVFYNDEIPDLQKYVYDYFIFMGCFVGCQAGDYKILDNTLCKKYTTSLIDNYVKADRSQDIIDFFEIMGMTKYQKDDVNFYSKDSAEFHAINSYEYLKTSVKKIETLRK